MNEKLTTCKNFAIAGLSFLVGSIAKKWLGQTIGDDASEALKNLLIGISGSATATEVDRVKIDFITQWELRRKNPVALNHDVLKLSQTVLNLSITEGIGKPYKKELENQGILTSELKKEIDNEINKLEAISESWKFSDSDAIKYVDFKGNYTSNSLEILILKVELPKICESLSFNDYFKTNFPKVYQIYFGELLKKPEYNKALIAYQRQVQNLMMEEIRQKGKELSSADIDVISEKINKLSCEDITKAMDGVNKSLQDITIRLDDIQNSIKQYFESKTLVIEALRGDGLKVKGRNEPIAATLDVFKQETTDYEFFEYKGYSHFIDELQEEDFNYFAKNIKVNHILISSLLNSIETGCRQWDNVKYIYDRVKEENDWIRKDHTLLLDCRDFIRQNLSRVITSRIDSLYGKGEDIDRNINLQESIKDYIEQSCQIVKILVDLSIAICLTCLWEDNVCITADDKERIAKYLKRETSLEEKSVFLYQLMNVFSLSTINCPVYLLPELLSLKEDFNHNGKLSKLCKELNKLKNTPDVNQFDCYRAEKILTEFFDDFKFLADCSMVSVKGVEYHNIKQCEPKYIQYCSAFPENVNSKISDKATFSHAVMLVNRTDDEQFLNLHPFVVDRSALKNKKESPFTIAFFNFYNSFGKYLNYDVLGYVQNSMNNANSDPKELNPFNEFKYKEIPDKDNRYSEKNIEQHNINCLLESFEKIKAILTV